MFDKKALLREIAGALSSSGDRHVEAWFTEDFRLHDPGFPDWPTGHAGAGAMLAQTVSMGPSTRLEALEMVEEGNYVAVRWRLTASRGSEFFDCAMMSMYRFEGTRIAEDWGIFSRAQWP